MLSLQPAAAQHAKTTAMIDILFIEDSCVVSRQHRMREAVACEARYRRPTSHTLRSSLGSRGLGGATSDGTSLQLVQDGPSHGLQRMGMFLRFQTVIHAEPALSRW